MTQMRLRETDLMYAKAEGKRFAVVRRRDGWQWYASVMLGAAGVMFLLLIWPAVLLQPSLSAPVMWPMIVTALLFFAASVSLCVRVRNPMRPMQLLSAIGIACVLGIGLFIATIGLLQDRILYMQPPLSERGEAYMQGTFPQLEEISIETDDHVDLSGWFIRNQTSETAPLLIYYGGSNENVVPGFMRELTGWNIAMVNYRGYGRSGGMPSEAHLKADALTVYDALSARGGVEGSRVVLAGRSLGSGIATHVASKRKAKGVVLISPYDSMDRVTRQLFPLLPGFLIHNHYKSIDLADGIHVPVLAFIGDEDRTVRPGRSRALMNQWAGEKQVIAIEDANHNSIVGYPVMAEETRRFLTELLTN